MPITNTTKSTKMDELLEDKEYLKIPKVGDAVNGIIISASRREVRLDIDGLTTGVVRGRELFSESDEYSGLKPGGTIEATVIDLENENGELELSFRFAGQQKAWEDLRTLFTTAETVEVKILDANKGGAIIRLNHIQGFLPVSQLSPEHYPRVAGGDKTKILDKLKSYVGQTFKVKVLDVNENDEKLIVSEKAVWEDEQKNVIAQYKIGDTVEGEITALADFGAFVKFDNLEGLVHISEIAWQRIDHPKDLLAVGQTIKAEVIGIEGSKIFLSMKKLLEDPWSRIQDKYKIGDTVKGKVLKVNPFGLFVELDPDIHGLAHVSELSAKAPVDPTKIASPGETLDFKIVSIDANEHRLGLSIKALHDASRMAEALAEKVVAETGVDDKNETEDSGDTEDVTEKPEEEKKTEEETPEEKTTE